MVIRPPRLRRWRRGPQPQAQAAETALRRTIHYTPLQDPFPWEVSAQSAFSSLEDFASNAA